MRLLSGIGAMLRRAFPGRSVASSQNEEQTVREQVTDAGYFETVSVRYASAQLIAIMLLAVFLGVSLLTDSDLLSADNLIYFAKDMTSSVSMRENAARDTLVYTASEDADRVLYRDGLAVLDREKLTVFTATGREAYSDRVLLATPRLSSSGRYLAAYDLGGRSYYLYNSFACVKQDTLDSPIRGLYTADDGSYCVITDGTQANSLVTLYNENFKPVNYYHIREYAVCADISDDRQIVIGSVSSQNGRMTTHLLLATAGKATEDASWTVTDAYPVQVCFTESGHILLVSTDALIWFDGRGRELTRHRFSSSDVRHFEAGPYGCVLLSRTNAYDHAMQITVLDAKGDRVIQAETDRGVIDVSLYESTLGVLTDGALLVYQRGSSEPVDEISLKSDYLSLLCCAADEFIVCGRGKAIVVRSSEASN